jgi:hypothetical protein
MRRHASDHQASVLKTFLFQSWINDEVSAKTRLQNKEANLQNMEETNVNYEMKSLKQLVISRMKYRTALTF